MVLFGSFLAAWVSIPGSLLVGTKAWSVVNGPCSSGPTAEPANMTVAARIWGQTGCIPTPSREPVAFAAMVAADVLAAPGLQLVNFAYWIFSASFWRSQHPLSGKELLCEVQRRLISGTNAEPPTLFEYLGLDAAKTPFWPPRECAGPLNKNYQAAQDAINRAYLERSSVIFPNGLSADALDNPDVKKKFDLLNTVTSCLLDVTSRQLYLEFVMPALAGPRSISASTTSRDAARPSSKSVGGSDARAAPSHLQSCLAHQSRNRPWIQCCHCPWKRRAGIRSGL